MAGASVEYKASVSGDLDRLDPQVALRILKKIQRALVEDGGSGEPLAGEFAGLFKLRVGDDRVIYARMTKGYLVLRIGHRGNVYRKGRS